MTIFPPEIISTTSIIALLRPVELTAPTIIPAVAIAIATLTIFIAPRIIPLTMSDKPFLTDMKNGISYDIVNEIELIEWFVLNYNKYGAKLYFISNKSQEGTQLVKGFGGICALLRWPVNFTFTQIDDFNDDNDFI